MLLNHRITRITVGILLLMLAVVVLLPGLTGFTSLDGTVNARFAVINAPIDGEVGQAPPRIGTPVAESETLLTIRNERVNRAILASLHAEGITAADRVSALERERNELVALRDQLAERLEIFKSATIASLERELRILQKRVEVSQAQDFVAKVDLDRRQELESRPDNAHAKAGNMNSGLSASSGDFIAIFDADFVPYRHFLKRTLPFFSDEAIGIVQTPQHFFNVDPVQSNLGLENIWPDEQRLFFDEIAPSRDVWDVSFCCGSCSIARRKAVDAIGGFPTESITEDLLTTLSMLNKGYKTRYLNERLSMGLAAENLTGYFVQRERWCQGGIQTLYLHNGPLRGPGLSLFQRIMFLPMSWLVQYVVRLIVLIVPIAYLWFGALPLHFTGVADYVSNQLPVLAAYFLLMLWITPTRYLPVVSSAVGTFATFRMLPTVVSSIVRPFGKPFKVTPKGTGNEANAFDAYTFAWIAGFITVTALGLLINIVPETARIQGSFSVIGSIWSGINIVVLVIASLICFEKPRRLFQAFKLDEPASVDGKPGRVVSLSLDKAVVAVSAEARFESTGVTLRLDGFKPLQAELRQVTQRGGDITRSSDKRRYYLHLHYDLDGEERDRMIVKLYTGRYSQDIPDIDKVAVSVNLMLRAFGRTRTVS